MNEPVPHLIPTWSFSRLEVYEKCPYQAYLKFVEKRPEPENQKGREAADRGKRVHEAAEAYVRGEGPMITELKRFEEDLDEAKEAYAHGDVELEGDWGFDRQWQPTGYYDDDVWLRVKLDQLRWLDAERTTARVVDYKTGRKDGNEVKHNQQGQLYVISTFMRHPELEVIDCEFYYLDHGKKSLPRQYTREKAMQFFPRFHQRGEQLTSALVFPAKPNRINCRYCPYSPNNGGDGSCPEGVDA